MKPVKYKWAKTKSGLIGTYHGLHEGKPLIAVSVPNWPFPKWVTCDEMKFVRPPQQEQPEFEEALM